LKASLPSRQVLADREQPSGLQRRSQAPVFSPMQRLPGRSHDARCPQTLILPVTFATMDARASLQVLNRHIKPYRVEHYRDTAIDEHLRL
jgi:hypothetical protein